MACASPQEGTSESSDTTTLIGVEASATTESTDTTETTDPTESTETTGTDEGLEILPGESVGSIALESTFGAAAQELGDADLVFVTDAIGFARYDALGLELVFSSPQENAATDDSVIFAIGVKKANGFFGEIEVGQTRAEALAAFGPPADIVDNITYFANGSSAMFDDNDRVEEIGVFAPYQNAPAAPEMLPAPQ